MQERQYDDDMKFFIIYFSFFFFFFFAFSLSNAIGLTSRGVSFITATVGTTCDSSV
jgi:hypothetical protein